MDTFRIVVAGSRSFQNFEHLQTTLDRLTSEKRKSHEIVIISGAAKGADQLGERYAARRGFRCVQYFADWNRYGKSAGHRRNREMAETADAVVAFWDGESRGTAGMIRIAQELNLPVRVIKF